MNEPEASPVTRAARQLAAQRRRVQRQCVICGQPITGISKRVFCGNRCAARAYRKRQKEAKAAQ